MFLIFFVISFLTNILGPLVPDIIKGFSLSLALAGFLPFSFFVAYGVMSIPAGMLLERFGHKPILVGAFVLAFGGSFLFASFPTFAVALVSLFTIGIGMTMLQVAINPLLRVAGGEENFAFYSVMAQLVFGSASFLSPYVYSYLVTRLQADARATGAALVDCWPGIVPRELPWVSLYWVFTVVTAVMVLVLASVRLPRVELKADERSGGACELPRAARATATSGCSSSASSPMSAPSRGSPTGSRRSCRSTTGSTPRWRAPHRLPLLGADDRRLPARAATAQAVRRAPGAGRLHGGGDGQPRGGASRPDARSRESPSWRSGSSCR